MDKGSVASSNNSLFSTIATTKVGIDHISAFYMLNRLSPAEIECAASNLRNISKAGTHLHILFMDAEKIEYLFDQLKCKGNQELNESFLTIRRSINPTKIFIDIQSATLSKVEEYLYTNQDIVKYFQAAGFKLQKLRYNNHIPLHAPKYLQLALQCYCYINFVAMPF